jgi:hypothetical protein
MGYRATYEAAFQSAHTQLDEIYQELELLKHRQELVERAMKALEPFVQPRKQPEIEIPQEFLRVPEEPQQELHEPIMAAIQAQPTSGPDSDRNVDPIQSRINRALGLAVA